jgi:hypothetical protein
MEPRISQLKHPMGVNIETPLLVSSFSSKGFKFQKNGKDPNGKSEVNNLILTTSEAITESALVSAFDMYYYLGKEEKEIRKLNLSPELLFIDSGGYETIEDYDLHETYKYPIVSRKWDQKLHDGILQNIQTIPSVFISYDNGQERRISLNAQVERAKRLFQKYPNQLNDFLIKPGNKKHTHVDIDEIVDNIGLLKKFHIIGLTEKELGESVADRMQNIKRIRRALDKIDCHTPLHIFGNLDPLTSILYYLSGAEIFDGLTWLRFAFYQGSALYKTNVDLLNSRQNEKDYLNEKMVMLQNLIYMRNLVQEMKSFTRMRLAGKEEEAFNCFTYISTVVKQIINTSK